MEAKFRNRLVALAASAFGLALAPASACADVVMPPPPHHGHISIELQQEVQKRAGPEMTQRMFLSVGAIAVAGDYRSSAPGAAFNLLLRDQAGWSSWRSGRPRAVAPALGAELDRLLSGDALWREDGFVYGQPCPGKGRRMLLLHRGRDKTTRQLCGPQGLLGRVADIAAAERVPPGPLPDAGGRALMAQRARGSEPEGSVPPPDADAAELVLHLVRQSAAAWTQGNLEAHLEPYAADVTMVWPSGPEEGKDALRRRARAAQPWKGVARRQLAPGSQFLRQISPASLIHTGSYNLHDLDKPDSFTEFWVTSLWQKRGLRWEITHEQVGPELTRRLELTSDEAVVRSFQVPLWSTSPRFLRIRHQADGRQRRDF
jgi:hypothetical protein